LTIRPNLPWRLKLLAARIQRRRNPAPADRARPLRDHAPGRSVCDVGCMWDVNGRFSFLAEEAGATRVTGVDVIGATPEFEAERARRNSEVRLVTGDVHDPAVIAEVGVHDLVWCSGVLYHSPYPVTTLKRLRELTGELLILQTCGVPELPGVAQGMVFYPGLEGHDRELYSMWGEEVLRKSIGTLDAAGEFGPWWWGITPSALRAMLAAADFEVVEEWGDPFNLHVLARAV
jgi:SAM-dependent methyltransferase